MAEWHAKNQAEVAVFFGITVDHLRKQTWFRTVKKSAKGYDLSALAQARFKRLTDPTLSNAESDDAPSLAQKRIEKIDQEISEKKEERAIRQGKLVVAEEVRQVLVEVATRIRSCLDGLATPIAGLVPSEQKARAIEFVEETIDQVLTLAWEKKVTGKRIGDLIIDHAKLIRDRRKKQERARKA